MSCDSGLGSSEESQSIKQESNALEGGESCKNSRTASQESDGHVSSSEAVDSNYYATPVESDKGSPQSEQVSGTFDPVLATILLEFSYTPHPHFLPRTGIIKSNFSFRYICEK